MKEECSLSASKLGLLFEFLEKHGIARQAFCVRIGLDPSTLEPPDNRIPLEVLERIFAQTYEITGDAYFGLHFGAQIEKGPSNILNYLMMNCSTIEEVLKTYCSFEAIQDDISQTDYWCSGGICTVVATVRRGSPSFRRQYLDSKFASMIYYAKRLTGRDLSLREIHFTHTAEKGIDEYERIFKCPICFGSEQNRIILAQSALKIRIREPNRELRAVFERHARGMLNDIFLADSYAAKVGRIVVQSIPGGIPRIEVVASRLEMSVRNLQLKLKEERSSYRAILDSVRRDMAMNLLRDQSMAITEIASMLGFSEPSVFHRTFKKWTTMTPRQFRTSASSNPL